MRCHTSLGSPGQRFGGGRRGGYRRQRAVEAHGILEVREAVRAEAPSVLRRVARGHVLVDGTSARRSHGLDEAAREARVLLLDEWTQRLACQ